MHPTKIIGNKSNQASNNAGHVYVIEVAAGICKIGASNNPALRIKTHAAALPEPFLKSFVSERVDGYMQLESAIHTIFSQHRIRNEVFATDFSTACETVASLASKFEPAATPVTTKAASPEATERWSQLCNSIERHGIGLAAIDIGFSHDTQDMVQRINPAAASIALAAALTGEAPTVEIAYAAIFNSYRDATSQGAKE